MLVYIRVTLTNNFSTYIKIYDSTKIIFNLFENLPNPLETFQYREAQNNLINLRIINLFFFYEVYNILK